MDLTIRDLEKEAARSVPPLCIFFYNIIFQYLAVLQLGGAFPWQEDKDSFQISCPDPVNQVTIKIKRIKV